VLRGVEDELMKGRPASLAVQTTAHVALYILNNKRAFVTDVESRYGITVSVQANDRMQGANFAIERSSDPVSGSPRRPERIAISMEAGFDTDVERAEVQESFDEPSEEGREGRRQRRKRRGRRSGRHEHDGDRIDRQQRDRAEHAPTSHGGEDHVSGEPSDQQGGSHGEEPGRAEADGDRAGGNGREDRHERRGRRRGRRGGRGRGGDRFGSRSEQPQAEGEDFAAPAEEQEPRGERQPASVDPGEREPQAYAPAYMEQEADAVGYPPLPQVAQRDRAEASGRVDDAQSAAPQERPERDRPVMEYAEGPMTTSSDGNPDAGTAPEPAAEARETSPPRRGWWQKRFGG
jgi:ribonuclease E